MEKTENLKKKAIVQFVLWAAVVLWMSVIFTLSSQQAAESSELSGQTIRTIAGIFMPGFDGMDELRQASMIDDLQNTVRKMAHVLAYMALGILSMTALLGHKLKMRRRVVSGISLCIAYAVTDELHQLSVSGRSGQVSDVVIDSAGALIGIGVVWLAASIRRRRAEKLTGITLR